MLRQIDAERIGKELMQQHQLNNWQLQFNKSEKHLGQCWYDSKVIAISVFLLNSREEAEFRDTMLHEIAHALVGPVGHNDTWKAKALELGCTSSVCGHMSIDNARSSSVAETKKKVHIAPLSKTCPICGAKAVETSRATFGNKTWTRLKCSHLVAVESLVGTSLEDITSKHGYKPFPYQLDGIRFLESSGGRGLIADEPGLGKTIQAMTFIKLHPELCPVLWVCKGSLKPQAVKETLEWMGPEYFPCTIDSSRSYIFEGLKMYIISMDLLRRISTEKLEKLGIKTIVADEIQHFKDPDSARTQELRRLVNKAEHFIALSGTPWKNRGQEYYPVLNMLAPERFGSYAQFQNRWVDYYYDKKSGKYKQGGIRNIKQFREYTKDIVIRRMRDDVLPDLPKINRQIRYIDLEEKYGENYERAEAIVAEKIKDILLEGGNMNSLQGEIMILKHITGLAKADIAAEDAIQQLEDTEDWQKLTIFHHHVEVGDRIEEKIKAAGYSTLRLRGGEDGYARDVKVGKFRENENNRVMIASTLASGEGLNLQFCQNVIQVERQWNPANEEQAELRFSRPLNWDDYLPYLQEHLFNEDRSPKKCSITVPYMIATGTIDEMLTEIVERKRMNYRKTMNVGSEELQWSENEVMKELAEMIIRKRAKSK